MQLAFKNALLGLLVVLLFCQCSSDPKLDDLKIHVAAQDAERGDNRAERAFLYNRHCCVMITSQTGNVAGGRKYRDYAAKPIVKSNQQGRVDLSLGSSFSVGTQLNLKLRCTQLTGYATTDEVPESECYKSGFPTDSNTTFQLTINQKGEYPVFKVPPQ